MTPDIRESKLPTWAREKLAELRRRLEDQNGPLVRELNTLRPKVQLLETKNSALTELLECAARGGHKTAEEIVKIIRGYDLELVREE